MRIDIIIRQLGLLLLFISVFLLISASISFFLDESSFISLFFSAIICLLFGFSTVLFVPKNDDLTYSEGIFVVVLGWLITCIAGMLPYVMWGGEFTLVNAWFESVSGFTTTGSSILNDIEGLPNGLLFWRSSTHWLGGVGIIFFVLLILPQTRTSRLKLFKTEMSDLSKITFKLKANKVLQMLMTVYVVLTLAEIILLRIAGMTFFDAINHSFATIATGGFSTKNLGIAYFDSVVIEIILMFFMVLSGIHFGLLYATAFGSKVNILHSSVARNFLLVLLIGIVLVTFKLFFSGIFDWWNSLRYASFQVISLASTTGFANIDTAFWPSFTQIILIYFIIQGAMVGSTSGAIKFDRVFIFFKTIKKHIKHTLHPRAIFSIKVDGKNITEQMERQTVLFIAIYILIFFVSTLLLTMMDIDNMTAFSASITTLGGVGPGFGQVSSLANFHNLPDMAKIILTINMLLGRLEIFNILVLFFIRQGR
jgi:trk system potassium uptake protein TrkH